MPADLRVPGRALQEYAVRKMDGINLEGSRILVEFAKENAVRAGARGGSGYRLIAEGLSTRTSWQDLKVDMYAVDTVHLRRPAVSLVTL